MAKQVQKMEETRPAKPPSKEAMTERQEDTTRQSPIQPDLVSFQVASFWEAAVVGMMSFALYVKTLPPSVVGGDSGEIVVSAWKLALPHPPGRVALRFSLPCIAL